MRVDAQNGVFSVKAISGTHAILIAINCDDKKRKGLLGFGFQRKVAGAASGGSKWLRSQKVFKSVVPNPKTARDPNDPAKPARFSTEEHPVQSFLWGDYTVQPGKTYTYTIVPMYGKPGALKPAAGITVTVDAEKELAKGHGVWFNRGAIASQAFVREFDNIGPQPPGNPDPKDPTTKWLSRGLLEACLAYINKTPAGDGLRVAAYEFTYSPVITALKAAMERGVDVCITYHDTTTTKNGKKKDGPNESAIADAGLKSRFHGKKVLFPRAKTKIPHNKFIVRLKNGTDPVSVWTGSTNFTPSGFLGQTNVGHLVNDSATAKQYLDYWEIVRKDPDLDAARGKVMKLTPDPSAVIPPKSIVRIFSPRPKSQMLKWYADRIEDATGSVMFTAAFGVAKQLVPALTKNRDFLRFVLMEKPPSKDLLKQFSLDHDLVPAYGASLGVTYTFKNGKPAARKKIKEFELDKWLLKEDHYRREGFVFFIHTKFLLIDPLSDDPLVCTGSANFSSNSLLQNDENMLLIRGEPRVADIYLTEFDRIFRHFYFRDVANEIEAKGGKAKGAFLYESDKWTDSYFKAGAFKTRRREMFFSSPASTWVDNAKLRATQSKSTSKASGKSKAKKAKPKTVTKKAKAKSTKKK